MNHRTPGPKGAPLPLWTRREGHQDAAPEQELVPTQAQAGQPERGTERRCLAPPSTRGPAVRTHVDPGPRGGDLERSDAREPVLGLSGGPAGVGLRSPPPRSSPRRGQPTEAHGSSLRHTVGKWIGTSCSRPSSSRTRIVTSRSSPAYGSARSVLVQRAEEVVPVGENHSARADHLDRLGPVGAEVVLALHAELSDAEVGHVGPVPGQRPAHEAGAALEQRGAAAGVLDQDRPRLAAPVGGRLGRGDDGLVDGAR